MNMSLNNDKTRIGIPIRDLETGVESVIECNRVNLIGVVVNKMRMTEYVVLREKMELTQGERLVLEHEDVLQRIRDKIDYLFVNHVLGMGYIQMSPQRHHHDQLKWLLKLEEPRWIPLYGPVICSGCKSTMSGSGKGLKVRDGICCGYNCYGMMLAAGQPDGH